MASFIWCTALHPGMVDEWRRFQKDLATTHAVEAADQRRRMGFTRHVVSLHENALGAFALNYVEADELRGGFAMLAASEVPFDVWFKQQAHLLYGVTPAGLALGPSSETIATWP